MQCHIILSATLSHRDIQCHIILSTTLWHCKNLFHFILSATLWRRDTMPHHPFHDIITHRQPEPRDHILWIKTPRRGSPRHLRHVSRSYEIKILRLRSHLNPLHNGISPRIWAWQHPSKNNDSYPKGMFEMTLLRFPSSLLRPSRTHGQPLIVAPTFQLCRKSLKITGKIIKILPTLENDLPYPQTKETVKKKVNKPFEKRGERKRRHKWEEEGVHLKNQRWR